jgi:outer membrane protein
MNQKYRWHLVWLALFLHGMTLFGQNQEGKTFTLDQAINYAQDNHPDIQLKKLQIRDAEQRVKETAAIGLPQINGGLEYQYFIEKPRQIAPDFLSPAVYGILFQEGLVQPFPIDVGTQEFTFAQSHNLTPSVTLSSLIFDGSYIVGLRAARSYNSLVQKDLNISFANVRKNVIDAYLPLLIIDENLKNLDLNITNLSQLLKQTEATFKEGFVEKLDVDRLKLSLSNLESERENLIRQRVVALNALKMQMGFPVGSQMDIEGSIEQVLETSKGQQLLASTLSVDNRPEVDYLNTTIALNELNIQRYKAGYLPSLSAYVSYQNTYLGDDFSNGTWLPTSVFGAKLNIPIFAGMGRKAQIERAKIDLEEVKVRKEQALEGFTLELSNAKTNFINAQARLEVRKDNLDLAQQIYETTQIKYKEGVGSSIEVSTAEQGLYQSQQYYYQAVFELLRAEADLAKALGQ